MTFPEMIQDFHVVSSDLNYLLLLRLCSHYTLTRGCFIGIRCFNATFDGSGQLVIDQVRETCSYPHIMFTD